MAQKLKRNAVNSENNSKKVSASSAYLRAASYYRFALASFSDADDPIVENYAKESISCYRKYLELSDYPGEVIEIPYGDTTLSGYFYRSPMAEKKAPLIILTPGRDTLGEDTVWVYDEALKRGIHCIVVEGPGQGAVLRIKKIPFRKDWETVVTPIIDYAEGISCIDMDRIALMGISFGGYLVPRAAAFEKRIKLCIANPGNISWGNSIGAALSMAKSMPKALRPPMVDGLVKDYAWKHGVENDIDAVIEELKKYDNSDILDKLTCKTLVMDATADINPGEAKKFYDAINCPKEYMLFDDETLGQTHTQMGCYASATERLFDWIEDNL